MKEYFELDMLIEDLAKIYSTALATTWFKSNNITSPTKEEYRIKVTEFMNVLDHSLSLFPDNSEITNLKFLVKEKMRVEKNKVISGENKDVEKRYRYFVTYKQ